MRWPLSVKRVAPPRWAVPRWGGEVMRLGGRQRRYLPEDAQVGSKTDARVSPKTRASEAKEW